MNSCFTYFKKNKKKTSIMFAIIILAVFSISFIYSLILSVYDTSKSANVAPFDKFSILISENDTVFDDDTQKIIDSDSSVRAFTTVTDIKTIFGTTSSYVIFPAEYDDINILVNRLGIKVSEGRMPDKNTDEIIMHTNVMKNKKKKIGDKISDYTIVGAFEGDIELSLGTMESAKLKEYSSSVSTYIISPSSRDELSSINSTLSKINDKKIELHTYDKQLKSLNDEFSSIKSVLFIIVLLVAVCIVIAVAALVFIMYSGRYEEFAIINALGYNKSFIKTLIFKEMLFAASISWFLGVTISWLSSVLVNKFIYSAMGQSMKIFNVNSLLISIVLPVMVILFSVYPTNHKLSKTDLISIIERR